MSRVLIVDDEPAICIALGEYLHEEFGWLINYANSGIEAADALAREHYDLAVLDAVLPGMPGLQLAAIAVNENTPVILISGHPETSLTLRQFGFPCLKKPFSLADLRAESARIMSEQRKTVERVKASVALMEANKVALALALVKSDRLVDALRRKQQLGRWGMVPQPDLTKNVDGPPIHVA